MKGPPSGQFVTTRCQGPVCLDSTCAWADDAARTVAPCNQCSQHLVSVLWSATVASVIPMVLRRFRIDPAVVSAPFIATLVDGTGLIIYFEIAKLILPDLQ